MQTLDELIRDVLQHQRCYAVQGNEWYGWWCGLIGDGKQVFVAFGGGSVYYSRLQEMLYPDLADPNDGPPTMYLAIFAGTGDLEQIISDPNPLRIDPNANADGEYGPHFDSAELERHLAARFGTFERATIHVKPFEISAIGVDFHPLIMTHERYLQAPEEFDTHELRWMRRWIDDGCSELLYGNDYFLGGDGDVTSS